MSVPTGKTTIIRKPTPGKPFRLFDFHILDQQPASHENDMDEDEDSPNNSFDNDDEDGGKRRPYKPRAPPQFMIQMFGINEQGETASIFVNDFNPFFFVKIAQDWTQHDVSAFLRHLKERVGNYHAKSILTAERVEHNKLYGFSGGRTHPFVKITFQNLAALNKTKGLWYTYLTDKEKEESKGREYRRLTPLVFKSTVLHLYESNIPPLLRFFHIYNVSPSGWVFIATTKAITISPEKKTTTCKYEFICSTGQMRALPDKETRVPYKICSFDIEASSSHGDFPIPVKTYKRLATNIVDVFRRLSAPPNPPLDQEMGQRLLKRCVLTGFSMDSLEEIDVVYPKVVPSKVEVIAWIEVLQKTPIKVAHGLNDREDNHHLLEIDKVFEQIKASSPTDQGLDIGDGDGDDGEAMEQGDSETTLVGGFKTWTKRVPKPEATATLVHVLLNPKYDRDAKIQLVNETLTLLFPRLEGDKATFIGSTFLRYGDPEPYLNHCLVVGSCDPVEGAQIQTVDSERDLLLQWRDLIQRENPDIMIGYNIFGFDYEFLFRRSQELGCDRAFAKLSRKVDEVCAKSVQTPGQGYGQRYDQGYDQDEDPEIAIENTKIVLASGEYDLRYYKMMGRLQIDVMMYFKRDFNLASYKLDNVASQYISDDVKKVLHVDREDLGGSCTELYSRNLTGLHVGDYIHLEFSGFTSDYYKGGHKFRVLDLDQALGGESKIVVGGTHLLPEETQGKYVKWGMAKDDIDHHDIFRLSGGSAADRAIVAKYCIQDCNLVHHLLNKIDVITGYVEMSRICSVPMSFLVFRGQGIKLTSYVAKKCREKNTLMPDLEKTTDSDGYEGAIVLPPKCSMYMDNPVACVDYASLYPSSMISQNYSHDSKVWTKEYDSYGVLLRETGERDASGNYIYDHLPGYTYIDIEFDTYRSFRKTPASRVEKVVSGKKVCRWAQLPHGQKSIMPAILEELLDARKKTRKMIKGESDPFMQNILDKRQLGYKVTANSLYGQCGAQTSTFFEQDVAASTTATGRQMITYAKRMIEEVYGDRVYETAIQGPVKCRAEYVYGDSVASYTPVYVRVGGGSIVDICTIEDLATKYGQSLWLPCLEEGRQEKEVCELTGVESWTEKGWTPLYRVIRHMLAPHKKMMRILTGSSIVDATDDHSLVKANGEEISPRDVKQGTPLLHYLPNTLSSFYSLASLDQMLGDATSCEHTKNTQLSEAIMFCTMVKQGLNITRLDYYTDAEGKTGYIMDISSDPRINREHTVVNSYVRSIEEIPYTGYVYDLTTENHHFAAGIGNMIVHNTDSVFFTFNLENPKTGEKIRGKPALEATIEIAQDVAGLCTQFLKQPMELTYEKTLMPFILLSKKRYVGMLYETDANKGKMKYMGLAIKRRDSCDYLKDVYGAILKILMRPEDTGTNIQRAIDYLYAALDQLIEGKVAMDKLTITRALKSDYKNPMQIGHWVLAERIGARDPGNKPKPGDRMKYVFIVNPNKKALTGDKIETPEFIVANNVPIDYTHYITNQLMKPLQQLFGLALEPIWTNQRKMAAIKNYKKDMVKLEEETPDMEAFMKKKEKYCSAKIKALLFDKFLDKIEHQRTGMRTITGMFG